MASAPVQAFLEFFLPVYHTILFPSHWLLSHITMTKTMDRCERRLNPDAMIIIDPRKEYWLCQGSNQPPVLKCCMRPTELYRIGAGLFGG